MDGIELAYDGDTQSLSQYKKGEKDMVEPLIHEDELIEFDERYKSTHDLINEVLKKKKLSDDIWRNSLALVEVLNIIRLEASSKDWSKALNV